MSVTIRSRLLLLVLSVLLPGLLGAAWQIGSTIDAQRQAQLRRLHDTVRALSMVIDRELGQRAAVARVLAQSRWLDGAPELTQAQLDGFAQQARQELQGLAGWVELRSADRTLLDTRPQATDRPRAPTPASPLAERPVVLPLQADGAPGDAHAALLQPVERGGRTVLNLVLTLRPAELQAIVDGQSLPSDWIGMVLDDRGTVVARHPGGSAYVGRTISAQQRERMAAGAEGYFESTSLDGDPTSGYFSTSAHGWTYLSAMPRRQFTGLLPQAVLQVGLGALTLVGLAVAGALAVSRSIVVPVQALEQAARRLQAGQPVDGRATGLVECDEVALALAEASEALRHGRDDLERRVSDAVDSVRQTEQRASQSQRVEALGRLTGGVAHDVNNLLGVVSNSARLIQRHPAATELDAPVSAILRAVDRGSQLTQHLLRFAGRRRVQPQSLALERYLPEMQELLRSVLGRRIEISVRVAHDTAPIRVDPGELELALVNLALNARDAMPRGGELRLAARNASPEDLERPAQPLAGRQVLITVSDDGVGIDPVVASRVFEPFFTTKPVGRGTGLGLSQVHGFCTQAGGTAQIASTPGLGTTVSLLLPADGLPTDEVLAAKAPPMAATGLAGARVLLVEDDEELAEVTSALLRCDGATVQRAADAASARRLLEAQPFFDVVLTDIVMPGEHDGLALARHIRAEMPALPVVLISGYSVAASSSELVVLRKPCSHDELVAALLEAMAGARTAGRAPPGA